MSRAPVVVVAFIAHGIMLGAAASAAQRSGSEPEVPEKAGKEFHAYRVTDKEVRVDGRFDEELWGRAQPIEDFVQEEPDSMAAPTERMRIRIAYDDRYVYVAAEMFMRDMSQLMTGLGRRGNAPPSDRVVIGFDASHDHQNAYLFEVNASGVQHDWTLVDDSRGNFDYEAVWEVATAVLADRWNAEFRIPLSQMRFPAFDGPRTVWGFNVRREIKHRGEHVWWIARPRGVQGAVSRYGHLVFDEPLSPPRRMEIMPFALARTERRAGSPADSAFNGGADVRIGVGTSATLSATVNPDFGQVEADPAVLNLSVFETFFPEKRPFFLEDNRVFSMPYGQFPDFYSRRIGQRPGRFALASTDTLVRQPDETTILGAAKLTGKRSVWTYGGLAALTSREYALVDARSTDPSGVEQVSRLERLIEPQTVYSVGRVQRDIWQSSNIGVIATAVVRERDTDSVTGGGDANLKWGGNRYNWSNHWLGTRAPVSGVMRNGFGGASNFSFSSKYFAYNGHYDRFSPNFRNTDLGFLFSRTNKNEVAGGFNVGRPDPWGVVRSMNSYVNIGRQWNDGGLVFGGWANAGGYIQFSNFWGVFANTGYTPERADDLDTRGGPPILRMAERYFQVGFDTDSRKSWQMGGNGWFSRSRAGDRSRSLFMYVRIQPAPRVQASLNANVTAARDTAQWIKNTNADGDETTDHVYGRLRRHVLNITGRATYAFTRDMTLEAFVQPFVAVGDYTDPRKLAAPRTFTFTPVSLTDDPDFNRKSLRGTVVLRWEYIRGSTLFAVWNLAASDSSRPGVFSPLRDLGSAFGASGTNVFALKISYWFTP